MSYLLVVITFVFLSSGEKQDDKINQSMYCVNEFTLVDYKYPDKITDATTFIDILIPDSIRLEETKKLEKVQFTDTELFIYFNEEKEPTTYGYRYYKDDTKSYIKLDDVSKSTVEIVQNTDSMVLHFSRVVYYLSVCK